MKQFLLLLHEDIQKMSELSPKEMQEIANAHMNWADKLAEAGHLISGDGLHEKGILITGKDAVVKDGPYLESKEIIGGYYLLQAVDLQTVVELAKECPTHFFGGTTEIRLIMEMEDYE
ncbi:YciI family protein [Flavobacterium sp.]|uniref:YciI family protein n=1 Tax=Flavobacterium sp. TaxID=239 RepID=UPI00263200C2|nr:YciI family protein [Flavobacterium sp.]